MPVGKWPSFAACVAANQDKEDPEAYCAAREQPQKATIARTVQIAKADEERRLVYGIVYEPDVPDAHDDFMTADAIEKAAHGFMVRYAKALSDTGTDHRQRVSRDAMVVVESFLAPVPFELNGQPIRKGTWIMVAKVLDEEIWSGVKSGRFTGWSFEGWGQRVAA